MRIPLSLKLPLGCLLAFVFSAVASADEVAKRPHLYNGAEVLCVGIDTHFAATVPALNQAVKDAKDFAQLMAAKYRFSPKLLLNKEATRKAIFAALDEIDARANPPEAVVLFFACHGVSFEYLQGDDSVPIRVGYLVPYDAEVDTKDFSRPKRWAEEAIGMRELVERIEKMKCRHVVLIADACSSGFLTKRGAAESRDLIALLSDSSRTILAATTQNELAKEGVFTEALIKVLSEAAVDAEALSVIDVFRKVRPVVAANPSGVKMTPQMSHVGAGDGEFVFIPGLVDEKQVAILEGAVAEAKKGSSPDPSKLVVIRGILERQQKLQARQSRFADVAKAMEATDYRHAANAAAEAGRWEESRRTFAENAEMGDVWAMAGLHFCYAMGLGTDPSPKDAYYWARQVGHFEKPPGLAGYLLARCYEQGFGVPKNEIAARRLYSDSAERGFSLAQVAQAAFLLNSKPDAEKRQRARELLASAKEQGVPRASLFLAKFHLGLLGDEKINLDEGRKLLFEAAKSDLPDAHFALYQFYCGQGAFTLLKNLDQAAKSLERAAEMGDARSQRELAEQYYGKEPIQTVLQRTPDFEVARTLAAQAVKQGDPGAHLLLALLYQRGDGVKLNYQRMEDHLKRAAELNYSPALNHYAECLQDGPLARDIPRAHKLLKQSADAGDIGGRIMLAELYQTKIDPITEKYHVRDHTLARYYHQLSHHAYHYKFLAIQARPHPDLRRNFERLARDLANERKKGEKGFLRNGAVWASELLENLKEEYPQSEKGIRELFVKFEGERAAIIATEMKKSRENRIHSVPEAGLKLEGETTLEGPRDSEQSTPCKLYCVKLEAGQRYSFRMETKARDFRSIYLRLLDETGKEVASNGNYDGQGRDAKIAFQPKKTGNYFLVPTSYNVGWGKLVGPFAIEGKTEMDK